MRRDLACGFISDSCALFMAEPLVGYRDYPCIPFWMQESFLPNLTCFFYHTSVCHEHLNVGAIFNNIAKL